VIQQSDEAFVLRTQALAESDLIVNLLAANHGMVRGVARAARKSRRRFGGLLEPMTQVRASWSEREGRDLHRIESLDGMRSFARMQADPALQAACALMSELVECFSSEGHAEPKSFRLLAAVLDALEQGVSVWSSLRYFEYWILRIHGFLPEIGRCADCLEPLPAAEPVWFVAAAGLRCRSCADAVGERGVRLDAAERQFLQQLRRSAPADLTTPPAGLRRPALQHFLRGALEYCGEKRFRAYRHLAAAGCGEDLP